MVSKKEKLTYLKNKYMSTCSELKPKNIEFELEDGYEFKRVKLFGGTKEGLSIRKIK